VEAQETLEELAAGTNAIRDTPEGKGLEKCGARRRVINFVTVSGDTGILGGDMGNGRAWRE